MQWINNACHECRSPYLLDSIVGACKCKMTTWKRNWADHWQCYISLHRYSCSEMQTIVMKTTHGDLKGLNRFATNVQHVFCFDGVCDTLSTTGNLKLSSKWDIQCHFCRMRVRKRTRGRLPTNEMCKTPNNGPMYFYSSIASKAFRVVNLSIDVCVILCGRFLQLIFEWLSRWSRCDFVGMIYSIKSIQ